MIRRVLCLVFLWAAVMAGAQVALTIWLLERGYVPTDADLMTAHRVVWALIEGLTK